MGTSPVRKRVNKATNFVLILLFLLVFGVLSWLNIALSRFDTRRVLGTRCDETETRETTCEPGIIYRRPGFPAIHALHELGALLEKKGFETGAKVGVHQSGLDTKDLLSTWTSCKELHLVNLWAQQENYNDTASINAQYQLKRYEETQQKEEPWKVKLKYHRMTSVDAAKEIVDKSLDFVYLDTRHDFCTVIEKLKAYWPKLRPGGIMAGHDYLNAADVNTRHRQDFLSVCADGSVHIGAAVEVFAAEEGLLISVGGNDFLSWFVQKPTKKECVVE